MLMADAKVGMRVVLARGSLKGEHGEIRALHVAARIVDVTLDKIAGLHSFEVTDLGIEHTEAQRIFQPGDRVRFNAKSEDMVGKTAVVAHSNVTSGTVILKVDGSMGKYYSDAIALDYIPPAETLARDYVAGDRIRVTSGKFKGRRGLVLEVRRYMLSVMLDDADLGMDFTKHDVEIAPDTRQAKSRDDVEVDMAVSKALSVQSRYSVGDVVFLTSDRRCDVPMTVMSATDAGAFLVAWLDPARQVQTFMAHEDVFATAAEIRRRLDGDAFAKARQEMPRGY